MFLLQDDRRLGIVKSSTESYPDNRGEEVTPTVRSLSYGKGLALDG